MSRRKFQQAIDLISDAVVLVNAAGEQVVANARAREVFGENGPRRAVLIHQIQLVKNGESTLPCAIKSSDLLSPAQIQPEEVWLVANPCEEPQASEDERLYCLIAPQITDPSRLLRSDRVVLDLIGAETRRDLTRMRELLIAFDRDPAVRREAIRVATHLDEVLKDVTELAELQQHLGMTTDERFFIGSMIRELVPGLPKTAHSKAIRYVVGVVDTEPSPSYGHSRWMKQALSALLTLLGESCPAAGKVMINVQQIGDFVIVTGKIAAEIGRPSVFADEFDDAGSTASQLARRRHLQIARRILEIHGGQLRLRSMLGAGDDDRAPMDSFTLSLPTGRPANETLTRNCGKCPVTVQAQRYAKDLAELMDAARI